MPAIFNSFSTTNRLSQFKQTTSGTFSENNCTEILITYLTFKKGFWASSATGTEKQVILTAIRDLKLTATDANQILANLNGTALASANGNPTVILVCKVLRKLKNDHRSLTLFHYGPTTSYKVAVRYLQAVGKGQQNIKITDKGRGACAWFATTNYLMISDSASSHDIKTNSQLFNPTNPVASNIMAYLQNQVSLDQAGEVARPLIAMVTLDLYRPALNKNSYKNLLITLIVNCSRCNHQGLLPNAHQAKNLLCEYKHLFDEQTYRQLVKDLVQNWRQLPMQDNSLLSSAILDLLFANKSWLADQEPAFYQQTITLLFDNISCYALATLLNDHGNVIPAQLLIDKHQTTGSYFARIAIHEYVHGARANREINLPQPYPDILAQLTQELAQLPQDGVAFAVHNFTGNITKAGFSIMQKIVRQKNSLPREFSIDDLKDKFNLLDADANAKSICALDKIQASAKYSRKLAMILPTIATFLDDSQQEWTYHQDKPEGRWKLWLEQSFFEAANAYSDTDGTSCTKGIYERLLTGFRQLHPALDALFVAKNVLNGYELNIVNILQSAEIKELVVSKLRNDKINAESANFEQALKEACLATLKESISQQIIKSHNEHKDKLAQTTWQLLEPQLTNYNQVIEARLNKFKDTLDNLEYLPCSDNGQSWVDQIKEAVA